MERTRRYVSSSPFRKPVLEALIKRCMDAMGADQVFWSTWDQIGETEFGAALKKEFKLPKWPTVNIVDYRFGNFQIARQAGGARLSRARKYRRAIFSPKKLYQLCRRLGQMLGRPVEFTEWSEIGATKVGVQLIKQFGFRNWPSVALMTARLKNWGNVKRLMGVRKREWYQSKLARKRLTQFVQEVVKKNRLAARSRNHWDVLRTPERTELAKSFGLQEFPNSELLVFAFGSWEEMCQAVSVTPRGRNDQKTIRAILDDFVAWLEERSVEASRAQWGVYQESQHGKDFVATLGLVRVPHWRVFYRYGNGWEAELAAAQWSATVKRRVARRH